MATGKKLKDIFAPTVEPNIALEVPVRIEGRPRSAEPYQKVTVTLYDRQVLALDRAALSIRELTGQIVSRAALIRAILDEVAESLNPASPGFKEAALERLQGLDLTK